MYDFLCNTLFKRYPFRLHSGYPAEYHPPATANSPHQKLELSKDKPPVHSMLLALLFRMGLGNKEIIQLWRQDQSRNFEWMSFFPWK